jgi:hypothetical protein
VNYYLVTSPAGRLLHEYRSVRELLEALRDAIAGHRSLLKDGKILYRTFLKTTSLSQKIVLKETRKEDIN